MAKEGGEDPPGGRPSAKHPKDGRAGMLGALCLAAQQGDSTPPSLPRLLPTLYLALFPLSLSFPHHRVTCPGAPRKVRGAPQGSSNAHQERVSSGNGDPWVELSQLCWSCSPRPHFPQMRISFMGPEVFPRQMLHLGSSPGTPAGKEHPSVRTGWQELAAGSFWGLSLERFKGSSWIATARNLPWRCLGYRGWNQGRPRAKQRPYQLCYHSDPRTSRVCKSPSMLHIWQPSTNDIQGGFTSAVKGNLSLHLTLCF